MEPQTISEWIDQTRGMREDDLVDSEAVVRQIITAQLDDLELVLLREVVKRGKDKMVAGV